MNKSEYLEKLKVCLRWRISKTELEDIMRDYAEYFEEGRRQSKADSEISARLGDPKIVAEQIIEESKQEQDERPDYVEAVKQEVIETQKERLERKERKEHREESKTGNQIKNVLQSMLKIGERAAQRIGRWIVKAGKGIGFLCSGLLGICVFACAYFLLGTVLFFVGGAAILTGVLALVSSGFGILLHSFWAGAVLVSLAFFGFGSGIAFLCWMWGWLKQLHQLGKASRKAYLDFFQKQKPATTAPLEEAPQKKPSTQTQKVPDFAESELKLELQKDSSKEDEENA